MTRRKPRIAFTRDFSSGRCLLISATRIAQSEKMQRQKAKLKNVTEDVTS